MKKWLGFIFALMLVMSLSQTVMADTNPLVLTRWDTDDQYLEFASDTMHPGYYWQTIRFSDDSNEVVNSVYAKVNGTAVSCPIWYDEITAYDPITDTTNKVGDYYYKGHFSVPCTIGLNDIEVTAFDQSGHTSTLKYKVFYQAPYGITKTAGSHGVNSANAISSDGRYFGTDQGPEYSTNLILKFNDYSFMFSIIGHDPSLSRDGKYAVYSTKDTVEVEEATYVDYYGVSVSDIVYGTTNVIEPCQSAHTNVNISPDNKYIGYIKDNQVILYDMLSGQKRVLVSAQGLYGQIALSNDGRYVVFSSNANGIVSGDNNGQWDVFLMNTTTNEIKPISVSSQGALGNGASGTDEISISADGRFTVFSSKASNLVSNDINNCSDIFVYDKESNQLQRASISTLGVEGNYDSAYASISDDGRFVAFSSRATNFIKGAADWECFVHDMSSGITKLVSYKIDQGLYNNYYVTQLLGRTTSITPDGRYILSDGTRYDLFGNDKTSPVTTISLSPEPSTNGWNTSDVTVTLTASDGSESGVDYTEYSFNNSVWNRYTEPFSVKVSSTVYYRSKDLAGNLEATKSKAIQIDKNAPVTTIDLKDIDGKSANQEGWFNQDVVVTLNREQGARTWYKLDDGQWTEYTVPFTVSKEAISTIIFYSADSAGNVEEHPDSALPTDPETTNVKHIRIDKTAPILTIKAPTESGTYQIDSTYIKPVSFEVTDNLSGLANSTGEPEITAIETPTQRTFIVKAVDKAGNVTQKSITVTINS